MSDSLLLSINNMQVSLSMKVELCGAGVRLSARSIQTFQALDLFMILSQLKTLVKEQLWRSVHFVIVDYFKIHQCISLEGTHHVMWLAMWQRETKDNYLRVSLQVTWNIERLIIQWIHVIFSLYSCYRVCKLLLVTTATSSEILLSCYMN